MTKVVITGSSGFLGRNLIDEIHKANHQFEIYALTRSTANNKNARLYDEVRYLSNDSVDEECFLEILDGSIVVNCAFPRNCIGNEYAKGLLFTEKIYSKVEESKAKGIINISSQSIYSQKRDYVAAEDTEVSLDSTYAVGKYSCELLLRNICKTTSFSNLRLSSLIGPGFNQRVVNRMVYQAIICGEIQVNDINNIYGFMDCEDACNAIISLFSIDPIHWKHVYNVGTNTGYTVKQIATEIKDALAKELGIECQIILHASDVSTKSNTAVSYERLNGDTGFMPRVTLAQSIKRIAHSFSDYE